MANSQDTKRKWKLLGGAFAVLAPFVILRAFIAPAPLIMVLNGLLVGSLVAVLMAFWPLLRDTIKGLDPFTRAEQMTLSFILKWVVIALGVSTSIYSRTADLPVISFTTVALARYLAIIAAIMQVTAPDFGLGLLETRDRKRMAASLIVGFFCAVAVILLQDGVDYL